MAIDPNRHDFFSDDEWATLRAICERIVPQPKSRSHPGPVAAMIDLKLKADQRDGYRDARLPRQGEAWRRGLKGLDAEAQGRHATRFHALDGARQDQILKAAQKGNAHAEAWGGMSFRLFFEKRLLHDIVSAYYAHPITSNEIGFGGPAGARGYVRMKLNRRDPWEASEAYPGRERVAERENALFG